MKALITGGAGFIGSHICDRFAAEGYDVHVVDNLYSGKRTNLDPAWEFHEIDVSTPELAKLFAAVKPDLVIHAAAQIRARSTDYLLDTRYNIIGSINVFTLAAEYGTKRIVNFSSGGVVYGEPTRLPCDESHPLAPPSSYGISKLSAERYLKLISRTSRLEYATIRPANIYGPRQSADGEAGVCSIFAGKMLDGEIPVIYGAGHHTRDYLFVSDLVDAVWRMAIVDKAAGKTYNVGTGIQTDVLTVQGELARITGYSGLVKHGQEPEEISHSALDYSLIKNELGWQPHYGLGEGLGKLVDWIKSGNAR
ncbi:NAD-dependent epimerase/dehydratase family protein [bacterium]|nr:NAD-dependent epimerase/dehydratase family protein [bacterium]